MFDIFGPFPMKLKKIPEVMLFPEAAPGVRGAYNFKKSRGRGYIRLKCEDEVRGFTQSGW
jgi:hypothetical protein